MLIDYSTSFVLVVSFNQLVNRSKDIVQKRVHSFLKRRKRVFEPIEGHC